jgi:hypothetical protein
MRVDVGPSDGEALLFVKRDKPENFVPGGARLVASARDSWGLWLCGAGLIVTTAVGLAMPHSAPGAFGIGYGVALDRFVALTGVQGLIYALSVWLLLRAPARASLAFILGIAALLRVIMLPAFPFLSNDMFRYVWDGWVQAHLINPYRYIPADPHLAFMRDAVVYPNINRATYAHTIYPPAAECLFFLITRLAAFTALPPVLAFKFGMVAFEAAGIAAILHLLGTAGMPRTRILIYAWNPLPVWEFAGNGHVDALTVCFVGLALLFACTHKTGLAALAIAVATLTKFLPLVLLPALWRPWQGKFASVFGAAIALFYAPYIGVGLGVFGFLGGYAKQEHLASGQGLFLADLFGLAGAATKLYLAALALCLVLIAAFMIMRPVTAPKDIAQRASLLIGALMLGLSPHYPWYYAWALIPACVAFSPAALWLATASFVLYLNPAHTNLFWPSILFGPFLALAALEVWLISARRLTSGAHP